MKIDAFKENHPKLFIEEFFDGEIEAWGLFVDRFGALRRQFKVDLQGQWNSETLHLSEKFFYFDGETQNREWAIKPCGDGRYEGRAADVFGVARGRVAGNAFNWRYDLSLRMFGQDVRVHVDDWMFLQPGGVLINRATISKLGIDLGTLEIFFRRKNADTITAAELEQRFAA